MVNKLQKFIDNTTLFLLLLMFQQPLLPSLVLKLERIRKNKLIVFRYWLRLRFQY